MLTHISLTARDGARMADFYRQALGATERRAMRVLDGSRVWRGNGLPGVAIRSWWLDLPGGGPFLEILEYDSGPERDLPAVNAPGYGHLAFRVPDIGAAVEAVLAGGGTRLGEITDFGTEAAPVLLVYLRDPEGNVLELEQH